MKNKLTKEEYSELCKLLISDSNDDFELGKNISTSLDMRWGKRRMRYLSVLSDFNWDFYKDKGLQRIEGYRKRRI